MSENIIRALGPRGETVEIDLDRVLNSEGSGFPDWWILDNDPNSIEFNGQVVTPLGVFSSDGRFQSGVSDPYSLIDITSDPLFEAAYGIEWVMDAKIVLGGIKPLFDTWLGGMESFGVESNDETFDASIANDNFGLIIGHTFTAENSFVNGRYATSLAVNARSKKYGANSGVVTAGSFIAKTDADSLGSPWAIGISTSANIENDGSGRASGIAASGIVLNGGSAYRVHGITAYASAHDDVVISDYMAGALFQTYTGAYSGGAKPAIGQVRGQQTEVFLDNGVTGHCIGQLLTVYDTSPTGVSGNKQLAEWHWTNAQGSGQPGIFRIDSIGCYRTNAHSAPADSSLVNGEMAVWFDQTNGAAKLMVKAKQADGTIRTGSLALV